MALNDFERNHLMPLHFKGLNDENSEREVLAELAVRLLINRPSASRYDGQWHSECRRCLQKQKTSEHRPETSVLELTITNFRFSASVDRPELEA